MPTNGAIVLQNGITGRDAISTAASCYRDSFSCGLSVSGTDYDDPMDNDASSHIAQVSLGGFYAKNNFVIKASYSHFDAMRLYFEQEGTLSVGYNKLPHVNTSFELSGFRAGLYDESSGTTPLTRIDAGFSAFVSFAAAALSLSCSNITLKNALTDGYSAPLTFAIGLYTTQNALGNQGIKCTIIKYDIWQFRVAIGEELRLAKNLAISGAVTTNPTIVSFGVTYEINTMAIYTALVNHPVLGWSKGFGMNWVGK